MRRTALPHATCCGSNSLEWFGTALRLEASIMNMRIALLRRRFSATGGAENYIERLAGELRKRGHGVTLVCEEWKPTDSAIESIRTVATNDPENFARAVSDLQLKREFDLVFSLERVPGCDLYRAGDGV